MFDIKYFYPSITQDLLTKALNFASEYIYIFQNVILMLYITQGNSYGFMAPIPGLRNKEVCLMRQWMLIIELKCASSWAHIR